MVHCKLETTPDWLQCSHPSSIHRLPPLVQLGIQPVATIAKHLVSNTALAILLLTQSSNSGKCCCHGDFYFEPCINKRIYINRQPGQGTTDEIGDRERLIAELRSAEQEYYENKDKEGDDRQDQKMIGGPSADEVDARRQQLMEEAEKMAQLDKDASDSESDSGGSSR